MNILVTGANGQLGQALQSIAGEFPSMHFIFTDKEELDITQADKLASFIKKNKVGCLINAAGYTAVDQAEDDKAGATLLNATAVRYMAEATAKAGALMVHISTDYVFEGRGFKPYTEQDNANPKTVYGKTKLDGEIEVIFNAKRAVIIRTSWLYNEKGHNFVKSILKKASTEKEIKVVNDQIGSPTYAGDLARAILTLIPKVPQRCRGEIYNFSNEGVASWYDFALAAIEMKGLKCRVLPVSSKEFKSVAQRPFYSVLNKARIKNDFGVKIPHWRESLKVCLEKM